MHNSYKVEERTIKDIVYNNTKCIDKNTKLNLIIYYKSPKASNFVIKNNMSPTTTKLQQSNVVYKFSCPMPHSQAVEYVGLCQTTLSRRLTYHGQNGSIYNHFEKYHNSEPTREQLTENTVIIDRASDRYRLAIKEALHIIKIGPLINKQFDNFSNILKLYSHRTNTKKIKTNTEISLINPSIQTSTPSPLSQDLPKNQQLERSESLSSTHTPKHINNSNDNDIYMPDMNEVLLKFGIDTSKFRTVSLKKYEKEMFLTTTQTDEAESPTISQRIKSMRRQAHSNKIQMITLTL